MPEAEKKSTNRFKQWPRRPRGGEGKACSVANCKRPYRAKGYCFFHYKKWRHGELAHARYRTCSKPDCRKKMAKEGFCEQHYAEWRKAKSGAAA
ncbi:MAG: vegetative protein [Myxococcales bacterium]|nr:vegetative protein [Myxococcales bacterium]